MMPGPSAMLVTPSLWPYRLCTFSSPGREYTNTSGDSIVWTGRYIMVGKHDKRNDAHLVPGNGGGVGGCLAPPHHEAAAVPGGAGDEGAARHHPAARGAAPEVERQPPRREVLVVSHLLHHLSDTLHCK